MLDNDSIISKFFRNKASLVGTNDIIEMVFNSAGNNLFDDLVLGVVETYESKAPKITSIFAF